MTIICGGTNVILGGVRLPQGSFEYPAYGTLAFTLSTGSTNVEATTGSVVVVDDFSATVHSGVPVYQWLLLGLLLSFGMLGLLALARRVARGLVGGRAEV